MTAEGITIRNEGIKKKRIIIINEIIEKTCPLIIHVGESIGNI
jgi:hypothetical protein